MPGAKCRFVVSIDTEEDIWGWSSMAPITCANVGQLPRLVRFLRSYGIRPTFFVSYQVLSDPSARAVIEELAAEDGVEIGCHVHPWNTPPYDDSPRRTVLYNLPRGVQASKIAAVTKLFEDVFGRRPGSFRAGRFGFGPDTAGCLSEQGYRVDSSVTPFFDWTASSGGQNYVGAPLRIYRLKPESGVFRDDPGGTLVEVPLTGGYTRLKPDSWEATSRFLDRPPIRTLHLGGIGAWVLGLRRTILNPESHPANDMLAMSRRVVESGVGHLHLFFHSSSLLPGLTPFTRSWSDVERLYDRMEEFLDRIRASYELRFVSVAEAARLSFPEAMGQSAQESGVSLDLLSVSIRGSRSSQIVREVPGRSRPRGIRASMAYLARYAYWRLGGYRRYRRVHWPSVKRLVFVCTGNICRSPYAEHVARARGLETVSFGIDTGVDGVANATALSVARERGVEMEEHRTTPVEVFQPRDGDLVVAMEPFQAALVAKQRWPVAHQVTLLGLWATGNGPVIPDPYGGHHQRFDHCFSVIERGIGTIQRRLSHAPIPPIRDAP